MVLGLSGGIDFGIVCGDRRRCVGRRRVRAVMLPYQIHPQELLADAVAVAKALGIRYDIAPIENAGRVKRRFRHCSRICRAT